jgi:hypothetical protein
VSRGLVALALALAVAAAATAGDERATTGPRIRVEPEGFDFGRVLPNRTLSKEFSIRNFGDKDLTIEHVSTTCGCTVADGYARTVKPGGTTPLRVTLETRSYSGRVERQVVVRSNDTTTPTLTIRLTATVGVSTAR